MNDVHKHYVKLVATQLLIAALVACFLMFMGPAVDRVLAGIIGFAVAIFVTVWPFKMIRHPRRSDL